MRRGARGPALCPGDIADELGAIPGMVRVEERATAETGYRYFYFEYEQPVDHDDPDGARFVQTATLLHRSYEAPMMLVSTGYDNYYGDYRAEPTVLFAANQLVIEHRYFGGSRPEPASWEHLRVRQAAADHHRFVEALRHLYSAAWVSTGASKGGMTSVFHRRFYPEDVSATLPYVAPISYGGDSRYVPFLAEIGSEECRSKVEVLQRAALERAIELENVALAKAPGLSFELSGGSLGAMEDLIVNFDWGYWQYLGITDCAYVPTADAPAERIYDFLTKLGGLEQYADDQALLLMPYFVQARVELGYPDGYPRASIEELRSTPPAREVLPEGVELPFIEETMPDIADWVARDGERLAFIYGEWDPWTAGAFELGDARDSVKYTVPKGTHWASVLALGAAERADVIARLERWTGAEALELDEQADLTDLLKPPPRPPRLAP